MPHINDDSCTEATELLARLTQAEREYILYRLISEKIRENEPGSKIPLYAPDGSFCGLIQSPELPNSEVIGVMKERAKRIKAGTGRKLSDLLEHMESDNEAEVRKFITSQNA